jgi:hypothetical protein
MKADGIGNRIYSDIVASTHQSKFTKNIGTTSVSQFSNNKTASDLSAGIERADQIAVTVGRKLEVMVNLLDQLGSEKSDIVREQLARFFNIVRAFIQEALHPTGDWSTDRIMSGKSVNVNLGGNEAAFAVKGERITRGSLESHELSKSPNSDDMQAMMQNVAKAQTSVKKLRSNLASARAQIAHHSRGSSGITL